MLPERPLVDCCDFIFIVGIIFMFGKISSFLGLEIESQHKGCTFLPLDKGRRSPVDDLP